MISRGIESLSLLQVYWIDRLTFAIAPDYVRANWSYQFRYSPGAELAIDDNGVISGGTVIGLTAGKFSAAQLEKYPQLASYSVFELPANSDVATLKTALKGQVAVAAFESGALTYVAGVQTAGVLDDLLYYDGALGCIFGEDKSGAITVRLWAPTAQSVQLLLFEGGGDEIPDAIVPMMETGGVWSAEIHRAWRGRYYLFDVQVYVPSLRRIVNNVVTDPYSTDLAINGVKSRLTDLNDGGTKPDGWDQHRSPEIRLVNDLTIWELHVREFSAGDESVPADLRGSYLGFGDSDSNGMRHLRRLAAAGLKAVHLLPTFHIASINEVKAAWKVPGKVSEFAPDGAEQQAAVALVQDQDAYNWGYDPVHYMTPEGAYAVDPDQRVKECRAMVLAIHGAGLRVIQDLVFNHTSSNGQAETSVLDKIVPGYYYRLDGDGNVLNNSCCSDTASEHLMMEKLMIDCIVQNARQYRIDGFRFDLMSFHFVSNMEKIQHALAQLTMERDGVDGPTIYLYGEGWTTGETANDALGRNASQVNMYGTGIGTFNDRIRDAVRGGGPFSDQRAQGFATGLWTASSAYTQQNQSQDDQVNRLMDESDWIRAGLAGNMRDFLFLDSRGRQVAAGALNYEGQHVGYTACPVEAVNYCSVHDNQTLFDAIQLKVPLDEGQDIRAKRQALAMSVIALGQGIPFFYSGDEILRSKDMDNNSYNSGDWFNKLDFTYASNNWGVGLPLAKDNESNWSIMRPLLANSWLKPTSAHIVKTRDTFEALLRIRYSSELFRMQTLAEVQRNLNFLHTEAGVIAMRLNANGGDYRGYKDILVIFNATCSVVRLQDDSLKDLPLTLHPDLDDASKFDSATGTAVVTAVNFAIFVAN